MSDLPQYANAVCRMVHWTEEDAEYDEEGGSPCRAAVITAIDDPEPDAPWASASVSVFEPGGGVCGRVGFVLPPEITRQEIREFAFAAIHDPRTCPFPQEDPQDEEGPSDD